MSQTLLVHASRFVGLREFPGKVHNGWIQWALSLCGFDPETPDEVPWCSAAMNAWCFNLGLPRSHSARARSWLNVGLPVSLESAVPGDVVVLARAGSTLDPLVLTAAGHVGIYAGGGLLLAGNQGDAVSVAPFNRGHVLGVRRLAGLQV